MPLPIKYPCGTLTIKIMKKQFLYIILLFSTCLFAQKEDPALNIIDSDVFGPAQLQLNGVPVIDSTGKIIGYAVLDSLRVLGCAVFDTNIYVDDSLYFGRLNDGSGLFIGTNTNINNLLQTNANLNIGINNLTALGSNIVKADENIVVGINTFPILTDTTANDYQGRHNVALTIDGFTNLKYGRANTGIGRKVGNSLFIGSYNSFHGGFAGRYLEKGDNNNFLGRFSGVGQIRGHIEGDFNNYFGNDTWFQDPTYRDSIIKYGSNNLIIGSRIKLTEYLELFTSANGTPDSLSNVILISDGFGQVAYTRTANSNHTIWDTAGNPAFKIDNLNQVNFYGGLVDANGLTFTEGKVPMIKNGQVAAGNVLDADSIIYQTEVIDFPSVAAGGNSEESVTISGLDVTDRVILNPDKTALTTNVVYQAFVNGASTLVIRCSNYTAGALDPASANFYITVIKN